MNEKQVAAHLLLADVTLKRLRRAGSFLVPDVLHGMSAYRPGAYWAMGRVYDWYDQYRPARDGLEQRLPRLALAPEYWWADTELLFAAQDVAVSNSVARALAEVARGRAPQPQHLPGGRHPAWDLHGAQQLAARLRPDGKLPPLAVARYTQPHPDNLRGCPDGDWVAAAKHRAAQMVQHRTNGGPV